MTKEKEGKYDMRDKIVRDKIVVCKAIEAIRKGYWWNKINDDA